MTTPATTPTITSDLIIEILRQAAARGRELRTLAQEQQQSDPGTAGSETKPEPARPGSPPFVTRGTTPP